MDNGSLGMVNNSMGNQPFFTAGPGEEVDKNDKETIDNINTSNKDAASWSNTESRRAGGMVMGSAMQEKQPINQEKLGEVTPAGPNQSNALRPEILAQDKDNQVSEIINFRDLVAKRDKISKGALNEVNKAVDAFKSGKITAAELDNAAWKATEAYVENSFERKLAA